MHDILRRIKTTLWANPKIVPGGNDGVGTSE